MENVETIIDSMLERNLNAMKENINAALSQKAADALEEKKNSIAASYFEQR